MTMSTKEFTKKTLGKKVLEGRVAEILNARELVINIGANKEVEPGMVFAVLEETPVEVRDPETKELLDVIYREKVRVKAISVREKITICGTYREKNVGGVFSPDIYKRLFQAEKIVPETLSERNEPLPPSLPSEESYVKINDRVVLVDAEERELTWT